MNTENNTEPKPKITEDEALRRVKILKEHVQRVSGDKLTEAEVDRVVVEGGALAGAYIANPAIGNAQIQHPIGCHTLMAMFVGGYMLGSGKIKRDETPTTAETIKRGLVNQEKKSEAENGKPSPS